MREQTQEKIFQTLVEAFKASGQAVDENIEKRFRKLAKSVLDKFSEDLEIGDYLNMSPAAGRELTAIVINQEHQERHGTPAPPGILYEAGFKEGEISMLGQILHCKNFDSHKKEPVPAWFLEWVEHLRENRKKFKK